MTHADRFATAADATWHLFAAFVLLLGIAYLAVRAWDARPRRNPFAAPADVQAWRDANWTKEQP